ncbi:MAG: hypothetical protein IJ680_06720 [Paludibacteraceae bacterium]|nr:hypothetical protein [Paludibacteraceae bacterium]
MDRHEFLHILADDGIEAEIIEGVVMMTVSEDEFIDKVGADALDALTETADE